MFDPVAYIISDTISFREFAFYLRRKGFILNASYGSGGWCIAITKMMGGRTYIAYSHDVIEAARGAFRKYESEQQELLDAEDITKPDLKFSDMIK